MMRFRGKLSVKTKKQTRADIDIPIVSGQRQTNNLMFIGEELYKLHASILILILMFQFVINMYKLI